MHKERLFQRNNDSWGALQEAIAGLTDEQLLTPGVTGHWSVRDLMAHVATWEEEALHALPIIVDGGRLPKYASQGGIDAFNARNQEGKHDSSLEVLRQEIAELLHSYVIGHSVSVVEGYDENGSWLSLVTPEPS